MVKHEKASYSNENLSIFHTSCNKVSLPWARSANWNCTKFVFLPSQYCKNKDWTQTWRSDSQKVHFWITLTYFFHSFSPKNLICFPSLPNWILYPWGFVWNMRQSPHHGKSNSLFIDLLTLQPEVWIWRCHMGLLCCISLLRSHSKGLKWWGSHLRIWLPKEGELLRGIGRIPYTLSGFASSLEGSTHTPIAPICGR